MADERMVRRRWVRRLTDPDEELTLAELQAVPAAMLLGEATVQELVGRLDAAVNAGRPVTMLETIVLTLAHLRDNASVSRQAAEHTEGMLGALDQFASEVAARSGIPYAASGAVRAALDAQRDERRRLADQERRRALDTGERASGEHGDGEM